MFYGDTIPEIRQFYFASWGKYKQNLPLDTLEHQIITVILDHPEYHEFLEHPDKYQDHTYYPEFGETNPFLHMGLHLAIREQIATNRPVGIAVIYQKMIDNYKDRLLVEHTMMEQLAEYLWQAQKSNTAPNEEAYLNSLMQLENKL